jgi:transposase
MMKFSVPPGYVRKKPPARPKLDPFIPAIDRILVDDKSRPKKQQHTAKRVFERLRNEHGFIGGITIVKDYVAGWRQRAQDMFVPLVHPPGHAQADFGEAIGRQKFSAITTFKPSLPTPAAPATQAATAPRTDATG